MHRDQVEAEPAAHLVAEREVRTAAGALRFAAPQTVPSSNGLRPTVAYGPPLPQSGLPAPGLSCALGACHGPDVPFVFGNLSGGHP